MSECVSVCMGVRVCVCESEREREGMCLFRPSFNIESECVVCVCKGLVFAFKLFEADIFNATHHGQVDTKDFKESYL